MCHTAAMADPNSTVRRRRLGMELRRLREQANLRIEQVAPELEVSDSTLSRIERGRSPITVRNVEFLLDHYGLQDDEVRAWILGLAREARSAERGWWVEYEGLLPARFSTYMGLEAEASELATFHLAAVDGLLQTEDYARAMITALYPHDSADDVERLVGLRMRRQEEVLVARRPPLRLWTVLDEATLRRPVGGPATMADQLARLVEASAMPNVTLQVLPYSKGAHAGLNGDLTIIELPDEGDSPIAYTEGPTGSVYIERPEDVRTLRSLFAHLRATALSPAESVSFIDNLTREMQ